MGSGWGAPAPFGGPAFPGASTWGATTGMHIKRESVFEEYTNLAQGVVGPTMPSQLVVTTARIHLGLSPFVFW